MSGASWVAPLGLPQGDGAVSAHIPRGLQRRNPQALIVVVGGEQCEIPGAPRVGRVDLVRPAPHDDLAADAKIKLTQSHLRVAFSDIPGDVGAARQILFLGAAVKVRSNTP